MIVKCVITISYVIKVAPFPWVVTLMVVTAPECAIKVWMLYNVYGFMKDLKQSLKYMPKYKFTPVEMPTIEMQLMPKQNQLGLGQGYGYDPNDKPVVDINANSQLLV